MNQVKERGYCVVCGKLRKQKYIQETNMYEDNSIIINVAFDERNHGSNIDLLAHKTCHKKIITHIKNFRKKNVEAEPIKMSCEDYVKYHPKTRNAITLKIANGGRRHIDYD
jgi:hypothetical protein